MIFACWADGGHQPLDPETALRVPAAVGEPDQRRAEISSASVSGSRGGRCGCLQRGQNFFSSSRSGSLRRFFLVM